MAKQLLIFTLLVLFSITLGFQPKSMVASRQVNANKPVKTSISASSVDLIAIAAFVQQPFETSAIVDLSSKALIRTSSLLAYDYYESPSDFDGGPLICALLFLALITAALSTNKPVPEDSADIKALPEEIPKTVFTFTPYLLSKQEESAKLFAQTQAMKLKEEADRVARENQRLAEEKRKQEEYNRQLEKDKLEKLKAKQAQEAAAREAAALEEKVS
jgi:hypothetical protein